MKRNHLFASAAIGFMLVATLPVQAQRLGGGLHGGVSSIQSARLGPTRDSVNSQTDLSASARAGARVDGLGRADQTAKTGLQEAGRDAGRAKADAVVAGRGAVGASESATSRASDTAFGATRVATGVTATGQSEARVRSVDTTRAVAGGVSTTAGSGTKAATGTSKPSAHEPRKPDSAVRPLHSSLAGETDANASAAVSASAH
jgi:hypothetical protein